MHDFLNLKKNKSIFEVKKYYFCDTFGLNLNKYYYRFNIHIITYNSVFA